MLTLAWRAASLVGVSGIKHVVVPDWDAQKVKATHRLTQECQEGMMIMFWSYICVFS